MNVVPRLSKGKHSPDRTRQNAKMPTMKPAGVINIGVVCDSDTPRYYPMTYEVNYQINVPVNES